MATDLPTDSQAFHRFLSEQLANGAKETTPEALLRQWRVEQAEVIEDIRHGITEMEAGRGEPLEAVDERIRQRFNIPKPT